MQYEETIPSINFKINNKKITYVQATRQCDSYVSVIPEFLLNYIAHSPTENPTNQRSCYHEI